MKILIKIPVCAVVAAPVKGGVHITDDKIRTSG